MPSAISIDEPCATTWNKWDVAEYTYIRIPSNDMDSPKYAKPFNLIAVSVLCSINMADKTELFNLNEVGLSDEFIAYVKENRDKVINYYNSPIYIELTVDNLPIEDEYLTLDEDLNLRTTFDMNPEKQYRIVISVFRKLCS